MGIENVINRFFGHVNGRTSGATIQSVRVLSRHPPIDWQPTAPELLNTPLLGRRQFGNGLLGSKKIH
jgi:hypothetical protein